MSKLYDGVNGVSWHTSLVMMVIPKTKDGTLDMTSDFFADLGMEASF